MKAVIRHLRRAALLQAGESLTDGQLLDSFLGRRDEAAFEALLRRHGPMVLGVCRRVLGNPDDAEDAFQATFLVLVRKAATVRPREMVGNWLYGVAYRTAMKVRTMNAKRRTKEKQARERRPPESSGDGVTEELLAQLDAELNRLPEKYRVAVVLCDLEGKSREEAARQLQIPQGTLSSRLAQARKLLAKRLSRYGAVLSAGGVAAVLGPNAARACVPHPLLTSTAKAGMLVAGGETALAVAVSAKVAAITEGVMKAMLLSKLKGFGAVALVVAMSTAAGLTYRAVAQETLHSVERVTFDAQSAGRHAPDDLEALRLEIEALRKELRATKERVKALEARIGAQKAGGQTPAESQVKLQQLIAERDAAANLAAVYDQQLRSGNILEPKIKAEYETQAAINKGKRKAKEQEILDLMIRAEIEAATKKLLQNPNDKQATEALEQALKRLKEQRKPDGATGGGSRR
jgi:RNA polymerase sigma factor (sigma-70 family)